MKKIILHVGLHKTGTTAIQNDIYNNREKLRKLGIIYPTINNNPYHHGLLSPWMKVHERYKYDIDVNKYWENLHYEAQEGESVLISSEELSRVLLSESNAMDLRQRLERFDVIKVAITFRHQIEYIQSIYLEISKYVNPKRFSIFLKESISTGYCTGLMLNYLNFYIKISQIFGKKSIVTMNYDHIRSNRNGISSGFFTELDLREPSEIFTRKTENVNVSENPLAVWCAQGIRAPKLPDESTISICKNVFEETFKKDNLYTIYTREEIVTLKNIYADTNLLLSRLIMENEKKEFCLETNINENKHVLRENISGEVVRIINEKIKNELIP